MDLAGLQEAYEAKLEPVFPLPGAGEAVEPVTYRG